MTPIIKQYNNIINLYFTYSCDIMKLTKRYNMKLKLEECIKEEQLIDNYYYYIQSGNFNIAYWNKDTSMFLAETRKGIQYLNYENSKPFHNTKKQYEGEYKIESNLIFNMTEYKLLLKDISEKRPAYTACFLNENDQELIISSFKDKFPNSWDIKCHHMTLNLGSCKDLVYLGNKYDLKVIAFSICEELGVAALKVESILPSDNDTKHITLAVSASGSAMNSNKLDNWTTVDNQIIVSGIVGECMNNGNVISTVNKKRKIKLI
jgi:hypothetical protein